MHDAHHIYSSVVHCTRIGQHAIGDVHGSRVTGHLQGPPWSSTLISISTIVDSSAPPMPVSESPLTREQEPCG